jgi:hypothetical protein
VGLPGVESRVPTSPARQCLCRGPTLLAFAWVFAFGHQVGDALVLFEKSVSVLKVHLTEAVLVEHGGGRERFRCIYLMMVSSVVELDTEY